VSESRKAKLVEDLARFYQWKHIQFDKPNYRRIERLPFVPLESEIGQLISAAGRKTGTFLKLLKETGVRPGEAWNLKWTDLGPERNASGLYFVDSTVCRGIFSGISQHWSYAIERHDQIEVDGEMVKNWEIYKIDFFDFYFRHCVSTLDTKVLRWDMPTCTNTRADEI
jgi:hypothetical protein